MKIDEIFQSLNIISMWRAFIDSCSANVVEVCARVLFQLAQESSMSK